MVRKSLNSSAIWLKLFRLKVETVNQVKDFSAFAWMIGKSSSREERTMRILFAGTPETAAHVLRGLVASGHEVVAVLTRTDSPQGRKQILTPSAVAQAAQELGIPAIKANSVDAPVLDQIALHKPDVAVVVAYGSLLKEDALNSMVRGWFNLHFSILPAYRGAAPVQRAIAAGEKETGVTLFKLDSGMDTGDILGEVRTLIGPDESSGELLHRLSDLGITLLNEQLPKIYSGIEQLHKQSGTPTLAPKITRSDAQVDFSQTSAQLHDLIRAMNPEPMAWAYYNEQPFRIIRSRLSLEVHSSKPGTLLSNKQVLLACGEGTVLELLEVQPSGKNAMTAADWLRGQTRLGSFN